MDDRKHDQILGKLVRLVSFIADKQGVPDGWEPCKDIDGLISQIDHMFATELDGWKTVTETLGDLMPGWDKSGATPLRAEAAIRWIAISESSQKFEAPSWIHGKLVS